MKLVGLLGYPVEHSLSPAMQNAAFSALSLDYRYALLPTPPSELERTLRDSIEQGYVGWNVTVPHKERIIPLLDEVSEEATSIGACNTVRLERGRLVGFNTDPAGFMAGLEQAGGIQPSASAVLLGAGGAARSVAWALGRAGHPVMILARRPQQAASLAASLRRDTRAPIEYGELGEVELREVLPHAGLLVNCTPAGQWPNSGTSPLPEGTFLPEHLLVYDLVYGPAPSRLLTEAADAGCRTQDGLAMLVAQGEAAFRIWTGHDAPVGVMAQACLERR